MVVDFSHGQQEAGLRLDLPDGTLDTLFLLSARSPDSMASCSDEGTATTQGLDEHGEGEGEGDEEGQPDYDLLTPPPRKPKTCSDSFFTPMPVPLHSPFIREPNEAPADSRPELADSVQSIQDELQV